MNRRSFLGGLLGLAATPLITPKKSFFYFSRTWKPEISLREMHIALGKATYGHMGHTKPDLILLDTKHYVKLWKTMNSYEVMDPETGKMVRPGCWISVTMASRGYDNMQFNGKPVVHSDQALTEFPAAKFLDLRKHFA